MLKHVSELHHFFGQIICNHVDGHNTFYLAIHQLMDTGQILK